jgi:hypothetical protein
MICRLTLALGKQPDLMFACDELLIPRETDLAGLVKRDAAVFFCSPRPSRAGKTQLH